MSSDDRFDDQARQVLADAENRIDAATLSKLHRARSRAVARVTAHSPFAAWLPASAVASAALAALLVTLWLPGEKPAPAIVNDVDLLTSVDSIEFIEDIEFYEWLETAEL